MLGEAGTVAAVLVRASELTILYVLTSTMDFRPREAPFFGDYFFRFGPIAFKFSHTSFQPKRRFLSIWSVNKKSIIRVLVIAS